MLNGLLLILPAKTEEIEDIMKILTYNLPIDVYLDVLNTTLTGLIESKIDFDKLSILPLCLFAIEMINL